MLMFYITKWILRIHEFQTYFVDETEIMALSTHKQNVFSTRKKKSQSAKWKSNLYFGNAWVLLPIPAGKLPMELAAKMIEEVSHAERCAVSKGAQL